jgi:predicted NBD/HSP70 family sugar kinase
MEGEAVLLTLGGEVRERRFFDTTSDPVAAIEKVALSMAMARGSSARMLGVGVASEDPGAHDLGRLTETGLLSRVFFERDCVTALLAESTFGVGRVEGGIMLIIVDQRVRASFLFRGAPFGGVHNRAGSIGLMRTGADHVPLDSVAGLGAFWERLSSTERSQVAAGADIAISPSIRNWVRDAAGHLVDAIVATAGFLAPGAILIGGDLPANIVEELIAQVSVERRNTAVRPVVTPWISPIRRTTFPGAGIAIGAALLPFFDQLLPSPKSKIA